MAFCSCQAVPIAAVRLRPRPCTSISRPGSFSMTSRVCAPNAATIRAAIFGPIPLIRPEPRYRSMPCTVAGSTLVQLCTSNWRPYFGCEPQRPTIRSRSPGCTPGRAPITVSRSVPERSVATRAIV